MMHVIQWTCPSWLVLRVQVYGKIPQGHFEGLSKHLLQFIKRLFTSCHVFFDIHFYVVSRGLQTLVSKHFPASMQTNS